MGGNEKIGLVARGKSLFTESGALPYPVDSRIVHVEGDTLNHDVFRLWLSWIHGALPQPRIPIPRLFGYISASEFDDYQDGVVVIAGFANHAWALVDEFAGPGIERVNINVSKTGMPHVFKQRDFWNDNTDERNREGRRTNERLPTPSGSGTGRSRRLEATLS